MDIEKWNKDLNELPGKLPGQIEQTKIINIKPVKEEVSLKTYDKEMSMSLTGLPNIGKLAIAKIIQAELKKRGVKVNINYGRGSHDLIEVELCEHIVKQMILDGSVTINIMVLNTNINNIPQTKQM